MRLADLRSGIEACIERVYLAPTGNVIRAGVRRPISLDLVNRFYWIAEVRILACEKSQTPGAPAFSGGSPAAAVAPRLHFKRSPTARTNHIAPDLRSQITDL